MGFECRVNNEQENKMHKIHKLGLLVTTMFLLVSCGSDGKEIDKKTKPASAVSETVSQNIQDTPLQGKIIGDVNGEAFTYFSEKERPGKIRETNLGKHLNLTFSTLPTTILTINISAYNGADTYVSGGNFKLLSFKDPRAVFKNKDDSKLIIIEDDDTHIKGNISFATVSEQNEEITINAKFDLTKVVIDHNNQEALLKEIKNNPSSIESLGDLKSDKDFILKAISITPLAFYYADKSLKADKDFILKALQENPKHFIFLMYVNKDIKGDKGFALKAIKINSRVLNLFDKKLRKNKDVIAASKSK